MTLAIIFESVGVGEWFVLLAVVLIVIGPKRLPETARKFGNYYSKFRRAADSFKRQLMEMDTEFNKAIDEVANEVADGTGIPATESNTEYGPDYNPDYNPDYDEGYNDETGEYGYDRGYGNDYADDGATSEAGGKTEPAEVASAQTQPKSDGGSIKIKVSPLPGAEAKEDGNKTA